MQRRGFLQGLIATAATLALDPERLLWIPERKRIFIPNPRGLTIHGPAYLTDIHFEGPAEVEVYREGAEFPLLYAAAKPGCQFHWTVGGYASTIPIAEGQRVRIVPLMTPKAPLSAVFHTKEGVSVATATPQGQRNYPALRYSS